MRGGVKEPSRRRRGRDDDAGDDVEEGRGKTPRTSNGSSRREEVEEMRNEDVSTDDQTGYIMVLYGSHSLFSH